jgi:hypothetical protein
VAGVAAAVPGERSTICRRTQTAVAVRTQKRSTNGRRAAGGTSSRYAMAPRFYTCRSAWPRGGACRSRSRGTLLEVAVGQHDDGARHGRARRLVWVLALVAGCDGQFRFGERVIVAPDLGAPAAAEPAPDAAGPDAPTPDVDVAGADAATPDAARPDAPPAPPDLAAPDRAAPDRAVDLAAPDTAPPPSPLVGWTSEGSELQCRGRVACSGDCGASCSARCRGSANCSLRTAAGASLECREAASCSFVLGGGSVRCREGATCTVRCLAGCTVVCEDATCRLQCAADPSLRPVTGTARCP